ncbi:MAG: FG-GAP repeat protein [Deltaproteobacteria bacterium]|nr:FG-GAP repeat protein [Deltaproteobacteria bacterium]
MRRYANILGGLAALGLAGLGCNPADFDDLADQAWADSQDPGGNSTNSNIAIGFAPRNDPLPRAQMIVLGDSAPTMQRFDYSTSGSFSKAAISDVRTVVDNAANGAELRFARNREAGLAVAVLRRSNNNYQLFGDLGEAVDGDTVVNPPVILESGLGDADDDQDVRYQAIAVGGGEFGTVDPEATFAGIGPLVDEPSGSQWLEAFDLNETRTALQCEFRPGDEVPPAPNYTLNPGLAVLGGSDADQSNSRYLVATDFGLRIVGFPVDPLTHCFTGEVDSKSVLVDGQLESGRFIGGSGQDAFGAQLGTAVLVAVDYDPGVGGFGAFADTFGILAPSGVSAEWGSSLAVGDFDDDGDAELAVGDPTESTVYIYELDINNATAELVKTITPLESRNGFGKSLAAVPFDENDKDLLVVGTDSDVITYFRIFTDDESPSDRDPR